MIPGVNTSCSPMMSVCVDISTTTTGGIVSFVADAWAFLILSRALVLIIVYRRPVEPKAMPHRSIYALSVRVNKGSRKVVLERLEKRSIHRNVVLDLEDYNVLKVNGDEARLLSKNPKE